ncbi:MAG: hypothetical protein ACJ71W_00635 [Terriglobales bacterium]
MSLRKIIDQTAVIAAAVANSGKVYKHLVWSTDDADVVSLFQDAQGRLNTIMITRETTPSVDRGPNDNRDEHAMLLKWYRSANKAADALTATEDTFQDDVEAMRTAFKNNRKLKDAQGNRQAIWCTPMSARMVTFVMFKGVLCNYAELVFVAEDGPFNTTSV